MFTFVNMEKTHLFRQLLEDYSKLKEERLSGRYTQQKDIEPLLKDLRTTFKIKQIGSSVLGKPIHSITLGKGTVKILAWSQMHGNESTTTKAVFDFLKYFQENSEDILIKKILEKCELCIIPMLNPDGASAYTRVNANKVDLNRDAKELKEIESRILRENFKDFKPDFCLNLHDQRTIFSAGEQKEPAVLSFLTPSMDENREIYPSRVTSMQLIAGIAKDLNELLSNRIGRYDDAFNINCTGDSFQSTKTPTILFEAGHFPNDYEREETRKYVFLALLSVLRGVACKNYNNLDYKAYFEIPENKKLFYDVVYRNAKTEDGIRDVAIQFQEKIVAEKFVLVPKIEKIAPEIKEFGHKEIECGEKKVEINGKPDLTENVIVNKITLNSKLLALIS
ncbi:Zinc carboxypeptidase [Salegentibacter echinorum]|uniref:Zinc carboxypeptidase n=2 Tax=Salegentibacter echinorum TaxID=1073325 RepID=A0A1M5CPY7_SALEC|nr:Zinc carboxypeptidase [Salegentibacter echinorum]